MFSQSIWTTLKVYVMKDLVLCYIGSNQYGQYTYNYIALIIPLALASIPLEVFVIALNLTVSVDAFK